ncbi:MAG TPA: histidine triad nucleotide-binding protein [Chlamydiales bacterium]|nr:histidine triad nucleotide-binding protein [Chlamydiales bacterium]
MTVFKMIIDGKLPAKKVYEDEIVLAIEDIRPVAPIHILIIPKKEIIDLQSVEKEDLPVIGHMIEVAQKLARDLKLENGYRLIANIGPDSGQEIAHLHFHLIAGKRLGRLG